MTKKIIILADPPEGQSGTSHLQPIIDFLETKGNMPAEKEGFFSTPHGTECLMQNEIDWDDLEAHFEFPPSIKISRKWGILRDEGHVIDIVSGSEG